MLILLFDIAKIPITNLIKLDSDRIIEIIRDEICNPDLNVDYLCQELSRSRATITKCTTEDFNVTPSKLIKNIKIQRILKHTFDHKIDIYKSAKYYGIVKADSFYKIINRRFDKNPTVIEYELVLDVNRKKHFLRYHKQLMIDGIII